eukprot:gene9332-biopygen7359
MLQMGYERYKLVVQVNIAEAKGRGVGALRRFLFTPHRFSRVANAVAYTTAHAGALGTPTPTGNAHRIALPVARVE